MLYLSIKEGAVVLGTAFWGDLPRLVGQQEKCSPYLSSMRCSICGNDTKVIRTRETDHGLTITRQRQCKENQLHRFETVERAAGQALHQVAVRRSGDGELAPGVFNARRLYDDVKNGVLGRLDDQELDRCVRAAVTDIQSRLPDLVSPLFDDERAARPGALGAIEDHAIRDAVERQLRGSSARMAHVLYALYIRGRKDRKGRLGWQDASEVLDWLTAENNYPYLAVPQLKAAEAPTDWWYPAVPAPEPRYVVKRPSKEDPRTDFRLRQFTSSIRLALLGRPDMEEKAYCTSQWVLWGLAGQGEVSSAQLEAAVLETLRRVDDIAYLRRSAIAKNITSVTKFCDEAVGLVTNPSPRLKFSAELGRTLPPTHADRGRGLVMNG